MLVRVGVGRGCRVGEARGILRQLGRGPARDCLASRIEAHWRGVPQQVASGSFWSGEGWIGPGVHLPSDSASVRAIGSLDAPVRGLPGPRVLQRATCRAKVGHAPRTKVPNRD